MKDCPFLPNPLMNNQEQQLNAAYHWQMNDSYAPTYNPGWRNHPNFSWNQGGGYQGGATTSATQPSGSEYAKSNAFPYQQQSAIVTPQSTPAYANPPMPPPDLGMNRTWTQWRKISSSFCSRQINCCNLINKSYSNSHYKWIRCHHKWVKGKEGPFPAKLRLIPGTPEQILQTQLSWVESTHCSQGRRWTIRWKSPFWHNQLIQWQNHHSQALTKQMTRKWWNYRAYLWATNSLSQTSSDPRRTWRRWKIF